MWESSLDHLFIEKLIDYTCEFRKGDSNSKNKSVDNKQELEHRKKIEEGLNDALKNMGSFTAADGKNFNLKNLTQQV